VTEACEAIKMALKQEAEGIILTLRIAPAELPETVLLAGINARFAVAFSEIADDEQLKPKPENKGKRRQNSNVMRAAITCGEPQFQMFLQKKHRKSWEGSIGEGADQAGEAMRTILDIESRRDLATDPEALKRYDKLIAEYEMWKRGQ